MIKNKVFDICVITSGHSQLDDNRVFNKCSLPLSDYGHSVLQIGPYGEKYSKSLNGINYYGFKPRKSDFGIKYRFNSLFRIIKVMIKVRAQVYVCHEIDVLLMAHIMSFFKNGRIIYDCHEFTSRVFGINHFNGILRKLATSFVRLIEGILVSVSYACVVPSEPVETYLKKKAFKHPLFVISPNFPKLNDSPIDIMRVSNYEMNGNIKAVFIGVIHERRGLVPFIKAASYIVDAGINLTLSIIGDGNHCYIHYLKKIISENNYNFVMLQNAIPYNKIWNELRCADFGFVLDPPIEENLNVVATKTIQYMSAALPVIVSDTPANRQLVNDHNIGIVVDPYDKKKISESLFGFISNFQSIAPVYSKNSFLAFKKYYNWDLFEPSFKSLFSQIL